MPRDFPLPSNVQTSSWAYQVQWTPGTLSPAGKAAGAYAKPTNHLCLRPRSRMAALPPFPHTSSRRTSLIKHRNNFTLRNNKKKFLHVTKIDTAVTLTKYVRFRVSVKRNTGLNILFSNRYMFRSYDQVTN
jgi:hypothetical protein